MWIMHKILWAGEIFFPAIVLKNVSHRKFKGSTPKKKFRRQNGGDDDRK